MTDRQELYDGLSNAAWGYFFLYFDVNLGNVSILPRFVGWLLLRSAAGRLKGARRDLALLRPLITLMALWSGADWLASWAGRDVDGLFLPLDLIIAVAGMYVHFQFFTDCAALAAACQQPGDGLDRRILRWRTLQTLLLTAMALWVCGGGWPDAAGGWLPTAAAVVYCVAGVCLMAALFALRRLFREDAPDGAPPAEPAP